MAGKIFTNYRRGDDPGSAQALFFPAWADALEARRLDKRKSLTMAE
jgi:hypothetical protein